MSKSIQERFEEYHRNNPIVYATLLRLAREAKRAGAEKLGISLLVERARWEFKFETKSNDGFKINNDFRSRYARLIMDQKKDLRDFFDLKTNLKTIRTA